VIHHKNNTSPESENVTGFRGLLNFYPDRLCSSNHGTCYVELAVWSFEYYATGSKLVREDEDKTRLIEGTSVGIQSIHQRCT